MNYINSSDTKQCPNCDGTNFIHDISQGYVICTDCGAMGDSIYDDDIFRDETTTYENIYFSIISKHLCRICKNNNLENVVCDDVNVLFKIVFNKCYTNKLFLICNKPITKNQVIAGVVFHAFKKNNIEKTIDEIASICKIDSNSVYIGHTRLLKLFMEPPNGGRYEDDTSLDNLPLL